MGVKQFGFGDYEQSTAQTAHPARALSGRDGGCCALEAAHRSERAVLPQDQQQGRLAALSTGDYAAGPSAAAVDFTAIFGGAPCKTEIYVSALKLGVRELMK